ncbi:MAG: glycosyltransferase family 9 protein [Planctomycetota bacterium]|nr:glycosyltransferase family 9 protein [Planctomycetota bacterium]
MSEQPLKTKPTARPHRILISRLSHVGDCILTIPVANAIRDAYPDAFIGWAIESPGHRLIRECPSVDEVILVPKNWLKKPAEAWNLRKKIRQLKFDVCVDPQSLTKSAGIAWLSGVKHRIGLSKPWGRELSLWLNSDLRTVKSRHVVDRSLEILAGLGIQHSKPRFDLSIPTSAKDTAKTIVQSLAPHNDFVVINPGAGWKSRQWSNQRFGEVAHYLGTQCGLLPIVTWFGDEEEKMADQIVQHSQKVARKADPTKLWELAALICECQFYLGCDTGPTHLAAALNTPCITLFGTTEPNVSGPYEMDPLNPIHVCIQKYYQSGSSRQRRQAENEAMMQISVEEVCQAADQMQEKIKIQNVA